jgi:hypothetical protein
MDNLLFRVGEPMDSAHNKAVPCPDSAAAAAMVIALSFIHYKTDYSEVEADDEAAADCRMIGLKIINHAQDNMVGDKITLDAFKDAARAVYLTWLDMQGARLMNWGGNSETVQELGYGLHNLVAITVLGMAREARVAH